MKLGKLDRSTLKLPLALSGGRHATLADFAGHWQPVNRYQAASTSSSRMPVYAASTRDGSLRQLLRRWSSQGGLQLDDRLLQDYPLPSTLAGFHHLSLPQALLALQTLYAQEQVMLELQGRQLLAWQDAPQPEPGASAAGNCREAAC